MRSFSTLCLVVCLAGAGSAAEMRQPVVPGSKYTCADLLRKVFPNLKLDPNEAEKATASKSVVIRRIGSQEGPFQCGCDIKVEDVRKVDLRTPGKAQVLLMFTLDVGDDQPTSELALFDLSGAPKLLDIAEMPSFPDDHGWLADGGFVHLNDSTDMLVIVSEHHNSNESYEQYTPIFIEGGKLKDIETFDLFSCRGCKSGDFEERITFSAAADPERPYNKLLVHATLTLLPDPPEERPRRRTRKSVREFTAEYRWTPAKGNFMPAATKLSQLAEFNAKQMEE